MPHTGEGGREKGRGKGGNPSKRFAALQAHSILFSGRLGEDGQADEVQYTASPSKDSIKGMATLSKSLLCVVCTFLSQVYDLLNPTHGQISAALARGGRVPGLRVRYSKADDFYVENLFTFECSSPEEVGSPL